jgi:hypothetical protein
VKNSSLLFAFSCASYDVAILPPFCSDCSGRLVLCLH